MVRVMRKKILTTILSSTLLSVPAVAMETDEVKTSHPTHKQIPGDAKKALENHLNVMVLENAIGELNEGKKDVCFLPLNFSTSEKDFLEKLEVRLPRDVPIGKNLDFQGSIFFTEEEKLSENSAFNKVKAALHRFFNDYTNAPELENPNTTMSGPEFLTNVIMEYSEMLLNKFNSTQPTKVNNSFLFISIKAYKENDAFLNFFRWHYDGKVRSGTADLKLAGAFIGAPTVFAQTADENRDTLVSKVDNTTKAGLRNTPSAEDLIKTLTVMRDKHQQGTTKHENINKEIDNVKTLESSNDINKGEIFRRLSTRMNLQALEEENLISGIVQPKPHEISLFTMSGEKPALHSEPKIDVPRIFFGLRLYESMRGNLSPMRLYIQDLDDPRMY